MEGFDGDGAPGGSPFAGATRFEREQPNDLFQVDFKGPMGRSEARNEPLSVLDDHSRYGVGLYAIRDHRWERARTVSLTYLNVVASRGRC